MTWKRGHREREGKRGKEEGCKEESHGILQLCPVALLVVCRSPSCLRHAHAYRFLIKSWRHEDAGVHAHTRAHARTHARTHAQTVTAREFLCLLYFASFH